MRLWIVDAVFGKDIFLWSSWYEDEGFSEDNKGLFVLFFMKVNLRIFLGVLIVFLFREVSCLRLLLMLL